MRIFVIKFSMFLQIGDVIAHNTPKRKEKRKSFQKIGLRKTRAKIGDSRKVPILETILEIKILKTTRRKDSSRKNPLLQKNQRRRNADAGSAKQKGIMQMNVPKRTKELQKLF